MQYNFSVYYLRTPTYEFSFLEEKVSFFSNLRGLYNNDPILLERT